jgi:hypothetical protein
MGPMPAALTISVLAFQDGDSWSAQCLEYDIATQAATLPDLFYEVERTLMGHLAVAAKLGREPFAGLKPAPQRYWDMYENAPLTVQGKRHPFRAPAIAPQIAPDVRVIQLEAA